MERDTWFAKMRQLGVNERFVKEIADTFGEYPGIEIVKALWNSDWGRMTAEHFEIEQLQLNSAMRQLVKEINDL